MAYYAKGKFMFKFQNKLCPVCRERFREGDDIAVCPECGTPHHRACYRVANKCSLEEFHASGFVWNGRLPDEPMPVPDISTFVRNLKEDEENERENAEDSFDDDEKSLTLLGLEGLSDEQREEFKAAKNLDPMRELIDTIHDNSQGEDGVSMQELIAYTGTSVWHYIRAFNSFRGMNEDGKKHYMSFNLCSGLLSPIYQFYRKMDLLGIIVTLISLVPSAFIVLNEGNTAAMSGGMGLLMNIVTLLPIVLLCLFGDYLFYLKAVKQIRKIRVQFEGSTESLEYIKALSERGRPSLARAALGGLAKIFLSACVLVFAGGIIN